MSRRRAPAPPPRLIGVQLGQHDEQKARELIALLHALISGRSTDAPDEPEPRPQPDPDVKP